MATGTVTKLMAELTVARQRTDALFARLRPEAFMLRPIAERHRLVFYLGHVDAFDWNLLHRSLAQQPSRNPVWEQLFAFGIDPVDGRLPAEPASAWPPLSDVRGWACSLRDDVDAVIESGKVPVRPVRLAIEHRLMHVETLCYLLNRVPLELVAGGVPVRGIEHPAPQNELIDVPAGVATLGHPHADEGWDNEHGQHRVEVPSFRMQRYPVTNGEMLRFVTAGGYSNPHLWGPSAWRWLQASRIEHPVFWRHGSSGLKLRAIAGEIPLPHAAPAYVSHAEASAYARWVGLSLPSEAQWHRAALGTPSGAERRFPWGDDAPAPGRHGNFGFAQEDPAPVDAYPNGDSAFGLASMVGGGWEWTRTVFQPFEGFTPLPYYREYSAPFFDGDHFVLKGASPVTDVALIRPSFRNWFQPHYPYVYSKFRCVEGAAA